MKLGKWHRSACCAWALCSAAWLPFSLRGEEGIPSLESAATAEEEQTAVAESSLPEFDVAAPVDDDFYLRTAALQPPANRTSAPSTAPANNPPSTRSGSSLGSGGRTFSLGTAGGITALAVNRPSYMIADNPAIGGRSAGFNPGTQATTNFNDPRNLNLTIGLPGITCSRTNIAENNSPLVSDRVYFSYRHFENVADVDFFSAAAQGGSNSLNLDRFTLGFEKTIGEQTSVELRAPLNSQLHSNLQFGLYDDARTHLPLNDYNTEFGNLSLILKQNFWKQETFVAAAGLGITLPTAPHARVQGVVDHPNLLLRDPDGLQAPTVVDYQLTVDARMQNQSVHLVPYLGYVHMPTTDFYTHGFIQVDTPVNQSNARIDLDYQLDTGLVAYDPPATSTLAKINPQTILRVDWGVGYWLINRPDAPYLNQLGLTVELHYTSTLNNSDATSPTQVLPGLGTYQPLNIQLCDYGNRVDTLNLAAGIPTRIGMTTFTHGFIVPLRTGQNRAFDFEYNFFVNRNF